MSLRYLTPRDLAHMTPDMIARRQAHWKGIIRGLQIEHEREFHGPANTNDLLGGMDLDKRCTEPGCGEEARSLGMCWMHYQRRRRAADTGDVA